MSPSLKTDTLKNITIKRVPVDAVLGLRHRMLRAGLPPETARFKTDAIENTWHIAAFLPLIQGEDEQLVSCASFMFEMYRLELAWRLRGMCTEKRFEKRGIGSLLLKAAEESIRRETPKVHLLWCDARISAIGFYEKLGWIVDETEKAFEIPTAGLHRKMYKRLS